MLVRNLKRQGLVVSKSYEKKRKILESEVTEKAVKEMNIKEVLLKIEQQEKALAENPSKDCV
jgi:hypothetical protein